MNLAQNMLSQTLTFSLAISIPSYIAVKYLNLFKEIKIFPYQSLQNTMNSENTSEIKTFLKINFDFWASEAEVSHLKTLLNYPEKFYGYIQHRKWLTITNNGSIVKIQKRKEIKNYIGMILTILLVSAFITFLSLKHTLSPLGFFLTKTGLFTMILTAFMCDYSEKLSFKSASKFFKNYFLQKNPKE